mmetsp:Transcript_92295/g.261289  ORF Transcript_92295/g.261289 Transcript_92295/m.261289 type:complete len:196 (+) Transcript_92295:84-671(+)
MPIAQPAVWVRNLLDSGSTRQQLATTRLRKFDANGDGVLDWTELCNLTFDLCELTGIAQPADERLRVVYDKFDKNHDGVLSEEEFQAYFKMFLRSILPQVEQAEADAEARYIAEQEAATAAEEARKIAFDAAVREECDRRIAAFTGTLAIATFDVAVQWVRVTAGGCGAAADDALVAAYLRGKFRSAVEEERAPK